MGDKFLPTLSQNLLENLDDDEYYRYVIIIEVGNVQTFRAHMAILNCRSSFLREVLQLIRKMMVILNYQIFYLKFFK